MSNLQEALRMESNTRFKVEFRDIETGETEVDRLPFRHLVDVWKSEGDHDDVEFPYGIINTGKFILLNRFTSIRITLVEKKGDSND